MLTQIYNGHVLTPEGWINSGSVIIEDCRIKEVSKSSRRLEGMDKAIDAHGMHVVPGGIDLHCHGGGGSDFNGRKKDAENPFLGGSGMGCSMSIDPVAFLVITDGNVRMMPVASPANSTMDRMVEIAPEMFDKFADFLDSRKASEEA